MTTSHTYRQQPISMRYHCTLCNCFMWHTTRANSKTNSSHEQSTAVSPYVRMNNAENEELREGGSHVRRHPPIPREGSTRSYVLLHQASMS